MYARIAVKVKCFNCAGPQTVTSRDCLKNPKQRLRKKGTPKTTNTSSRLVNSEFSYVKAAAAGSFYDAISSAATTNKQTFTNVSAGNFVSVLVRTNVPSIPKITTSKVTSLIPINELTISDAILFLLMVANQCQTDRRS